MIRRRAGWALGVFTIACGLAAAQVTVRASVATSGVQGNGFSYSPVVSSDGRFVAFWSGASNLVPGDTNGKVDVFVRDRLSGTTELVSAALSGGPGNGDSYYPAMTPDGRYVAFQSSADNLVAGDTNGTEDIFVRDRLTGTTERVSVDSSGGQADFSSQFPGDISADGRFVSFQSVADNLVPGDTNNDFDVFVHDRATGITERVSVDSAGVQGDSTSDWNWISPDGRFVVFTSLASNLGPVGASGTYNVFLRDRLLDTTELVSVSTSGTGGNDHSFTASICAGGRFVSFSSLASNLVPGDMNHTEDTFLRDREAGTTELLCVNSSGVPGDHGGGKSSISSDGRYIAFESASTNLVPGDTNDFTDVFVRDRILGTTVRVSVASDGRQANMPSEISYSRALGADGRFVVFDSGASNFVGGDTNGTVDVFLRDALAGPSFTSLCEPGVAGVAPCPCANPPAGSGSGCDNSASTGGAVLAAAGGTFVSSDSLAFETTGEMPNALSILLQGNAAVPNGLVYGQGVRCIGGALKRLFTKTAASGTIRAPDFGAGDASVTARSAAKGDAIHAGESRWYLVYYRDPAVLGGCPAGSTFNATQTGRIDWSP